MSASPAPEAPFRVLPARRGVEVVSPTGVPWATCQFPSTAHAIAVLLSECHGERLVRLLAEGDKL
ncbi:MAG: hypothetical protein Q8P41_31715 [Pseudomonadota bacterium]|nr:hypothetical protein [Pseudomonadota bacterium]